MPGDALFLVSAEGVHEIPGLPPGNGRAAIPHAAGFLGMAVGGAARVWWPSDQVLRQARRHAVKMRSDTSVMECVELRERATALLDWRIECDREDAPYQEAKAILEKIFRRIPRFTQYRENLLHAIWFGRYGVANVYAWDWIDRRRCVVVQSWTPLHGDKLVWRAEADPADVFDGLGIRVGGTTGPSDKVRSWYEEHRRWIESTEFGWAYFPPPAKRDVLIVHRHYIEDGEYEEPFHAGRVYGVGIRDRIYWIWYQKQDALAWLMEFLERSAFGIELWYYPAGNLEGREEMKRAAAERAGPNKNILLVPRPPGVEGAVYGVERIEPSQAGAGVLKEIILEYFGHQIKRYILGQTLTTEAHATGLGSNLAAIHLDTFLQIIRYDAINLQETITDQLLRRLANWNFPELDPAAFRLVIELERDDTHQRLEAIQAAFNMGLKLRSEDLRQLLDLTQPAPDEEFLQNPAYREAYPPPGPSGREGDRSQVPTSSAWQEQYTLPPGLPSQPKLGQRVTLGGKVYVYAPNAIGRPQWQVEEKDPPQANLPQNVLVSANREALDLTGARAKLKGPEQRRLRRQAARFARQEQVQIERMVDTIGNWPTDQGTMGAENSLLMECQGQDPQALLRTAVRIGQHFQQEAVAFFQLQKYGRHSRWTATLTAPTEKVLEALDRHDVKYRTIVELPKGKVHLVVCEWAKILGPKRREFLRDMAGWIEYDDFQRGKFWLVSDENYAKVLRSRRREKMADDEEREDQELGWEIPWWRRSEGGIPWYMDDKKLAAATPKLRALGEIARHCYIADQMSDEEWAEYEKELYEMALEIRAQGGFAFGFGLDDEKQAEEHDRYVWEKVTKGDWPEDQLALLIHPERYGVDRRRFLPPEVLELEEEERQQGIIHKANGHDGTIII